MFPTAEHVMHDISVCVCIMSETGLIPNGRSMVIAQGQCRTPLNCQKCLDNHGFVLNNCYVRLFSLPAFVATDFQCVFVL